MSDNGAPLLQLSAVDTYYGPIHILQGVELQVRPGELVCLLGGNASGKSTTLKTILGIVRPRSGTVEFARRERHGDGRPTTGSGRGWRSSPRTAACSLR